MSDRLEELLARYVEHCLEHGSPPPIEELCAGEPELVGPLRSAARRYHRLQSTLALPQADGEHEGDALPRFEGFRTVERLGRGGGGEVYKLEDLQLGRVVAGKVLRAGGLGGSMDDFLREARSLALFDDPRIVRLLEVRTGHEPPVLLMEHVDGFDLASIGPSLEYAQRARIMAEIAEAVHRAHSLGIQHRDLKPANLMLDANLVPRILDFGLSRGEQDLGHGVGTLEYMAPEQLDPGRPIDARSDVYALGVVLYELLCGSVPYSGDSDEQVMARIREGCPRLPVEVEPGVPEPLQAIALKAMEPDPGQRYESARELAAELRRFIAGSPVLARPTLYQSALAARITPHLQQIREWLRIRLVYPHEAERLSADYERLLRREDDWIVHGRSLSLSQIALYLGAFLLVCGGLLYYQAYLEEAVQGVLRPLLVLGLPFVGLNVAARVLLLRQRRAVAVALLVAAAVLLPLLLVIVLSEGGLWPPDANSELELFAGAVSNRQLQVALLVAVAWSCWLALGTRTLALSTIFTTLLVLAHLAVLTDLGLRPWFEEGRWDLLGVHLLPLLLLAVVLGSALERGRAWWMVRPLYFCAAGLLVAVLELLAQDGKALAHLGLSMAPFVPADAADPVLLDTLTAMAFNGVLFYVVAWLLERFGNELLAGPSRMLYVLSPFATLEPLFYLCLAGEYSLRWDWFYLVLALTIAVLSHYRQRRSFYSAGIVNTGAALWLITDHNQWYDRPLWALGVGLVGITVLALGWLLDTGERRRRTPLP